MGNQLFSVQIPTNPFLLKFLQKRYGSPIQINNKNLIGIVLISVMDKHNFHVQMKPKDKERFIANQCKDALLCVAPLSQLRHYNYHLKPDHIIAMNRFFSEYFDECLYLFVAANITRGQRYAGYDDAIFGFAELHNIAIGQDVTFDCLKKREQRFRQKIHKKLVGEMSLQNSTLKQLSLI